MFEVCYLFSAKIHEITFLIEKKLDILSRHFNFSQNILEFWTLDVNLYLLTKLKFLETDVNNFNTSAPVLINIL